MTSLHRALLFGFAREGWRGMPTLTRPVSSLAPLKHAFRLVKPSWFYSWEKAWVYIKSWKPGVFTHGLDQAANWDRCQNLVLRKGRVWELQVFVIHCHSKPLWEIVPLLRIQGLPSVCMSPVLLASPYPPNFYFPPAACFQRWLFSCLNISALANLPVQSQSFSASVPLVSWYWRGGWVGQSPSCPKTGVGCVPRGASGVLGWASDPAVLPPAPLWPLQSH